MLPFGKIVQQDFQRAHPEYPEGPHRIQHFHAQEAQQPERDSPDILQWTLDQGTTGHLDDGEIRSTAKVMLGAVSETTSNTMAWAVAMMLQHPEVLEKLREELDKAFLDPKPAPSPGEAQAASLPRCGSSRNHAAQRHRRANVGEFPTETAVVVHDYNGNPKTYSIPAGTMTYL
ncbi:hypothetical protein M427DRAFT_332050 [Gonapodya prolifera JEL478]|uniref:Cytochrome P450 n=1 Tax=Gonapodya prolifera (strain JEL478) TaxID=1344416 RepID=A0A139AE97_GONPJ|nr:hypothetical protein M427DRAFT_332050 [Gonapodya prolifera JEL478]|eukprot:KXS14914.1 hypothetical protein M427DRAFT_332050 [Gonapodya prolifera JEL478]